MLEDLAEFARIELASHDLEPWAELIAELGLSAEETAWLVKLYNAYDDLGSAWHAFDRWPDPYAWCADPHREEAAQWPCTQERRGLRGGRINKHLDSYLALLAGDSQLSWLRRGLVGGDHIANFTTLTAHMRKVWGCGRQSAFEWAEFVGKALPLPVEAGDAQLWESEGPRRSLQRLYGNDKPTAEWLDDRAVMCRLHLAASGAPLEWWDFETVICDFNVMRDGRYYPGRHLAALREEIDSLDGADRMLLLDVFARIIPEPWAAIAPGIDKAKLPLYRDTGRIVRLP